MSLTLVLKCLTPVLAAAVAGLVWWLAGPIAAGLAGVTFLLGVVTSELHQVRWSAVETSPSDSALLAMLDAAPGRGRPKRTYRTTSDGLAIGSGVARTTLAARSRRELAPPKAPAPPVDIFEAELDAAREPSAIRELHPAPLVFRSGVLERVAG